MNTEAIISMLNSDEEFLNKISKDPTPEKLISSALNLLGIDINKKQAILILANLELQLDFDELENIVGGIGRLRSPLDKK